MVVFGGLAARPARAGAGHARPSASPCWRSARSSTSPASTPTSRARGRCCATCRSSAWRARRRASPSWRRWALSDALRHGAGRVRPALAASPAPDPGGGRASRSLVELWPAPRPLYSADDLAGLRRRPPPTRGRCGSSSCPSASATAPRRRATSAPATSSTRRAHGKPLMGGYLSRVSARRVREVKETPMLSAFLALSEGRTLPPRRPRGAANAAPRRSSTRPASAGWSSTRRGRRRRCTTSPCAPSRSSSSPRTTTSLLYRPGVGSAPASPAVASPLSGAARRGRQVAGSGLLHSYADGSPAMVPAGVRRVGRGGPDLRSGLDATADAVSRPRRGGGQHRAGGVHGRPGHRRRRGRSAQRPAPPPRGDAALRRPRDRHRRRSRCWCRSPWPR